MISESPNISVVCPFYNEAAILEAAIRRMLANLAAISVPWELIVVNDGSTDGSPSIAEKLAATEPRLRFIGYSPNQGRGYAIRTGIDAARGAIVVSTEIDCSWGDDIVQRIIEAFHQNPGVDMIIASPNLLGGGYRNVPAYRVWLSRVGNHLIRLGQSGAITMYTGMTRGYRREKFLALPLDEPEKEFHLEVARKAQAFDYKIMEIPAILEWQDHRLAVAGSKKRKSSSRVKKLMGTHFFFAIAAAPFRYILPLSALFLVFGTVFLSLALYNYFFHTGPAAFYLITALLFLIFSFLVFAIGILSHQAIMITREVWKIRGRLQTMPLDNGVKANSPPTLSE